MANITRKGTPYTWKYKYTWDEWEVEQAALKKEMHRKSQFKIRREDKA